jgi:hypothetical protein
MGILGWPIRLLRGLLRYAGRFGAWMALALWLYPGTAGAETASGEYSLKAAFIYNFSKFVEWPDSALQGKKEFCIGTLGRSPLDRSLAPLSGKIVQGRSIVFRQLNHVEEAAHCQVVFVSRSELSRLDALLDAVSDQPVLTIGDRDDFPRKGGMLTLEQENGRIVFDVNLKEILHSRLKPSSQLLKLARRIYSRP